MPTRFSPLCAGRLTIAGLGPGSARHVTPEVLHALHTASDIVGYQPYVDQARQLLASLAGGVPVLHPSDNRQEPDRARHALELAAQGRQVVVVSSGDPGVFAMAAAVFEVLEQAPPSCGARWRALDIEVLPGITAMLAAAARAGAPLGHDFCCINLSDNLKPWSVIERRVCLALEGDFAIALYNPRSRSRPEGFARLLEVLRMHCEPQRLLTFARAVSTPQERLHTCTLAQATPSMADMRTVVLIGSSRTRRVHPDSAWVYTPRHYMPGDYTPGQGRSVGAQMAGGGQAGIPREMPCCGPSAAPAVVQAVAVPDGVAAGVAGDAAENVPAAVVQSAVCGGGAVQDDGRCGGQCSVPDVGSPDGGQDGVRDWEQQDGCGPDILQGAVWVQGWLTGPGIRHLPSPNFGPRPAEAVADLVVVHSISLPPGEYGTGCVQQLFTNRLDWEAHPYFQGIRGLQVSAHFLIERDGTLWQFVSADDRAWHAGASSWRGRGNCNDDSVGIELEGLEGRTFTAAQYAMLAAVCACIARQYPLAWVAGHEHIAPGRKQDPGPGFDWQRLHDSLPPAVRTGVAFPPGVLAVCRG